MNTLPPIEAGYYQTDKGDLIKVTMNKAGTRSYAERMIVTADEDGVKIIEWVYQPGLGYDLLIFDLTPRAASRRVQAALAA